MTYDEILSELDAIGFKEEFVMEFEDYASPALISMIKCTDEIKSTGALIIVLMKKWENESMMWLRWQKILQYFMMPVFVRDKKLLPIKNIKNENK